MEFNYMTGSRESLPGLPAFWLEFNLHLKSYLIELRIKPESCAFKRFCNTVYTNKTKSRAEKQKKNHNFSANCRLKKLSFVLLFYVSELLQIYFIISFCSIYIQTKIYIPAHSRKRNIPSRNKIPLLCFPMHISILFNLYYCSHKLFSSRRFSKV